MSDPSRAESPNARFLKGDVPGEEKTLAQRTLYALRAGGVSAATHVAAVLLIVLIASRVPEVTKAATSLWDQPKDIVWIAQAGDGGGGGGGGNKMPDPPRRAEAPGVEKITVPVTKPVTTVPAKDIPKEMPKPEQQIVLPAVPMASGVQELPGTITGLPTGGPSQGSGSGGGVGTGVGTGIGPGRGPGLGPGEGGGSGGGPYKIGNGVLPPRLIREVKPNYTGEAMRAKIQGIVTMQAVVNVDGSVGNVVITKSLDPTFGLDQEAIRTVKQWRFAPGTRFGQPVPVEVEIEMTFTLR
jgi:TonB family protein